VIRLLCAYRFWIKYNCDEAVIGVTVEVLLRRQAKELVLSRRLLPCFKFRVCFPHYEMRQTMVSCLRRRKDKHVVQTSEEAASNEAQAIV